MRGMRQASNRAAKTAISFQCWVQESERGMFTSWIKFISTVSIYRLECMICTHFIIKGLIPFQVFFFFLCGVQNPNCNYMSVVCVFFLSKLN